jgi:hypothetical protein
LEDATAERAARTQAPIARPRPTDPALRFLYDSRRSLREKLSGGSSSRAQSSKPPETTEPPPPTASFVAVCAAAEQLSKVKRKIEGRGLHSLTPELNLRTFGTNRSH